jgi:hypothetical protein
MRLVTSKLARLRHAIEHRECLLMGVDLKWLSHGQNDAIDPDVWSGRALQGDFAKAGGQRSCINVSGL